MVEAPDKTIEVHSFGTVKYAQGLRLQKEYKERLKNGGPGYLLLLEHTPVITNGRFAGEDNFSAAKKYIEKMGVEVYRTDRGGDLTYHGPGQLVAYPIIDLRRIKLRPKEYIHLLEEALIQTLGEYGIRAQRKDGYPGVWVINNDGKLSSKIASIGVSINNGVTSHGSALNVNTELSYFSLIVPCGISDVQITSMKEILGEEVELSSVANTFSRVFIELIGSRASHQSTKRNKLVRRA